MRFACLAVLLLTGCSLTDPEDASGALLHTDQRAYATQLVTDGPDHIAVSIPYETRNTTGGPLYLIGCLHPPEATLEKWIDEEWVTVYSSPTALCLSPPWVLEAGETRRDTLHVRGYLPGQNIAPTFDADVPGRYRLRYALYTRLTNEETPLGRAPLSAPQNTSNTFELLAPEAYR